MTLIEIDYGIEQVFETLSDHVFDNSADKGFWKGGVNSRNKGEMIALMHSELSECLEAIRHPQDDGSPRPDHHCPEFSNEVIELADCIIRICDYAGAYNLPLGEAIVAKHNFNCGRPHKHGKEF